MRFPRNFWPYRLLKQIAGFRIFEGVYLSESLIPNALLATTTLLFQTPDASPLFVITSLPILIHMSRNSGPSTTWMAPIGRCLSTWLALCGNSSSTSWDLLEQKGEAITGQAVFSLAVALASDLSPWLHRSLCGNEWLRDDGWEVAVSFGMIWAAVWALFERLSPFGRYGIPSLVTSLPAITLVHRLLGTAGIDILLGTTGYIAYQTGSYLLPTTRYHLEDVRSAVSDAVSTRSAHISAESSRSSAMLTPSGSPSRLTSDPTGTEQTPLLPSTYTYGSTSSGGTVRRRSAKVFGLGTVASWLVMLLYSSARTDILPLSASLSQVTPLSIGFVHPPSHGSAGSSSPGDVNIDTLIHEAQTIANRANLLIFPETAFVAKKAFERYDGIDRFVEEVCKRYGVYIQLGIDSHGGSWGFDAEHGVEVKREGRLNEVVLLSPDGEVGRYSKQKLIPYVESYPFKQGLMPVPTWQMYLTSPNGVNKTDWTPNAPHVRAIRFSPLICLDSFHPQLLAHLDPPPDIITISASSPTIRLGHHLLAQAESIALTHSIPVVLVSSGRHGLSDGSGLSALLDGWGRHLHLQREGKSVVVHVAVPYGQGKERRRTLAEFLGTTGVLGAGIGLLVMGLAVDGRKGRRLQIEAASSARRSGRDGGPSASISPRSTFSLHSIFRQGSRTQLEEQSASTSNNTASNVLRPLRTTGDRHGTGSDRPRRSQMITARSGAQETRMDTPESSAADSVAALLADIPDTPTPLLGAGAMGHLWGIGGPLMGV